MQMERLFQVHRVGFRMVARQYKWLDVRGGLCSPSFSAANAKLLPALAMPNSFCEQSVF